MTCRGGSQTQDKALFRIGGACFLATGVIQMTGYVWNPTGIASVFDLEPSEGLRLITLHTRKLQFVLDGQVLSYVLLIPYWLALYQALKERKRAYAMLGAGAGILDSMVVVATGSIAAAALTVVAQLYGSADETNRTAALAIYYMARGAMGLGGVSTALRVPQVGLTSLALLGGQKLLRWLGWLGITTAVLTIAELGMWVILGSPNEGVPVGYVAASLGVIWEILAAVWLLRARPYAPRDDARP